jgi:hypothetical protein
MSRLSFNRADVHNVKYADDISIIEFVPHGQVGSISLEDCVSRFNQEGLFVNRSKCKQMCVRQCKPHDIVDDCGFDRVNVLKILGFTFMDSFKWNAQISEVLRRASQRLHIIRCLKNCMSTKQLTQIYHAIITSLFLYASPVYGHLSATLMAKMEKFQNRSHRLICGSSCSCDAFPSLEEKFERAALQLLLSAETNEDHSLHAFVPERLSASGAFRLPVCHTTIRLNSFIPWACRLSNFKF